MIDNDGELLKYHNNVLIVRTMKTLSHTVVGSLPLRTPIIAGAAEHLIFEDGIRAALRAGAGVVVVKSTNESEAARDQLQRAEYLALDEALEPVTWGASAPRGVTIACRSGLSPLSFAQWLEQTARMDREAARSDQYVAASLIMSGLDALVEMARQVEQAGVRLLEVNIGTPYASVAAKGAVSTELDPERVRMIVARVRAAVRLPIWVKLTGQSERVPQLALAAREAGADAVVMAGRLLGLIPDLETQEPMLGTVLGVGGAWNVPLTCHWLALSRKTLGSHAPLIGTNGVQDWRDVARMMLAGAHAVQMSSAVMMRGSAAIAEAVAGLEGYLSHKSMTAPELVGRAADACRSFADMPLRQDNWKTYVTP